MIFNYLNWNLSKQRLYEIRKQKYGLAYVDENGTVQQPPSSDSDSAESESDSADDEEDEV